MANTKYYRNPLIAFCCIAAVFFAACNASVRNPCLEPTVPKLNVSCYQYNAGSNTFADTLLPNAVFVSLDIDSARYWYYGADRISKFALVLSPLRDTARWLLQADSGYSQLDTISFIYERKLKFYSNACGYGYDFLLSQVLSSKHNMDSVTIFTKEVSTKAGVENVKIFF
jgi:hypothetical protein